MEAQRINTQVTDLHLDRFLNQYKVDGQDVRYGHVLVRNIEKSRYVHISSNWQTISTHDTTA